jgi:hypothetical protein
LLLCSSYLPLGVPNRLVIIIIINYTPAIKPFSGAVAGEEVEDFCKGSFSHAHPLLCFIVLLYFIFTCIVLYQKHKKIVYFIVAFIFLLLVFAKMSNLEVEVRSFKQQGGENLKDAWYCINNAHRRCTKRSL